ncbi:hypothetical protein AAKU52_003546 [Pedobacter sp. CG_S7]|uniref:DUF6266 family protein n=1 Tax=Pedobacter sp. CG_S7 TaxID=3143930 RepID=UPI00339A60DC
MAKLPQGIFGAIQGKIKNIVGVSYNGISYIRSAPAKSNKPKSLAQINNMERFKFLNEQLTPFHSYITIGFQNQAKRMTPINVATSRNYKQFVIGIYPDLQVDFSKLVWSEGNLPQLNNPQLSLMEPDKLKLTWQQDNSLATSFDDQLLLVVYCPALKIADGFIGGTERANLECSFQFNPKFIGYDLEVYVSLTSLDRKKIANSQYLGRL